MNTGIDIGYSAVKVKVAGKQVTFPSVVGTPDRARFSLNGPADDIILDLPDGKWLVGQGAIEQSRFAPRREDRAWISSDEYQRLMLAAFTELTAATSCDLVVVTGLPVAFYGDKDQLQDAFRGTHRATREGRRSQVFRVSECRVIPQPFGALLSEALDERGRIADNRLAQGTIGVIDVGGKTTNLLSVSRLTEIAKETASVNVGAWDTMRAVRDYLAEVCPNLEIGDHRLMEATISRHISYYGETVNIAPFVDTVLKPMAEQVIAQATQLWNGGAGLDAVLVAGGGALLLGERIGQHFPHARVVSDPVFANVDGYWKLAQRVGA
jgi:actin-like ATPase involved in cell morphogenesis